MALGDIPTSAQPRRLDSWKEIAEYLGRDVRTATRWESQGLPLHRVPGGKGRSVFAFTTEIDDWMAGRQPGGMPPTVMPAPHRAAALVRRAAASRAVVVVVCGALGAALAAAALASRTWRTPLHAAAPRIVVTDSAVSIASASGATRVIHTFAPDVASPITGSPPRIADLNGDGDPEILLGVSSYENPADRSTRSGELLALSMAGDVRWRFAFRDVARFRDGIVRGPWALADWQPDPAGSPARIAVAAHDYVWWASIVAVLDHDGRRLGAFVNPGWVESLLWVAPDRLATAGFNNARNEAMLALLDANAIDGQAPGTAGTPFACVSCASGPPLFYATFPRSELNLLTGAPFNRARVTLVGDRIQVTTIEIQASTATAIYDFDREFRLTRARYSEGYWDAHRRLAIEGRLAHTPAACPERDGPRAIHVWAGAGWKAVVPEHTE